MYKPKAMKRKLLQVVWMLFFGAGMLSAQISEQGNFVLGSTFGFSTATSKISKNSADTDVSGDGPSSTQISFAPNVGYFVLDNWSIGIGMSYTFSRVEDPNLNNIEDANLLFGPFTRYYLPLEDDKAFFLQADFGFGNATDQLDVGGGLETIKTNIFAIGIGPGFTIVSNEAIGIEALLKYNYARSDFDTEANGVRQQTVTKTNQFDFSIGLQFYFSRVAPARVGE